MHPSQLSIRLTQPVVPLRSIRERTSRHHDGEMLPPAVVRGLLTLKLARPTKVSSIELELQAKAVTHYTQAAGRTRIEITEQYKVHSASMSVFKVGPTSQTQQRAASAKPRVQFLDAHTASSAHHNSRRHHNGSSDSPVSRSASLDPRSLRVRRHSGSHELETGNGRIQWQDQTWTDATPPYPSQATDTPPFLNIDLQGPSVAGRSRSTTCSASGITGLQSPSVSPRCSGSPDIPPGSPVSSMHSSRDHALSRTSSNGEILEDTEESMDTCAQQPDNVAYFRLSRIATNSSGRSSVLDPRGRSHSQFSLRSIVHVVDAVKNRVRSRSPRAGSQPRLEEQGPERGRSLAKGKGKAQVSIHGLTHVLSEIKGAGPPSADDANSPDWIMFPEGTYTYPIFFTIPNSSPPTMKAEHGTLTWRVKAEVRRPGTLNAKITASEEVIVICQPMDSESEDIEGIDLEKQWENQFRYRVQIAGHAFPVGGKVPFELTILPLAKIKVHCISVCLDERTEYYTQTQSRARLDTIRRATLLVIRHTSLVDRYTRPILPLSLEEANAFHKSPLYRFINPGEDESAAASSFMGPGPWTIRHELQIPESCSVLHHSNKAKGSNVMVSHTLKITLRVEREEPEGTAGKKKLYDIIIQVPMVILSCRCTSEWITLPRYYEALRSEGDSPGDTSTCPCRAPPKTKARTRSHATDSSPAPSEPMSPLATGPNLSRGTGGFSSDSLAGQIHLYEQLVSGLVSERGEVAPSYTNHPGVYV